MGMPLVPNSTYSLWISRHFWWENAKMSYKIGGRQNLNPGPPACQPGMLPQDQRGFDDNWGLELCFYTYVAGNSNWECPTWNKGHPHGKKQNGVCSSNLSPSLEFWIFIIPKVSTQKYAWILCTEVSEDKKERFKVHYFIKVNQASTLSLSW